MKPDKAICANCIFYVASTSGKHGYCREAPPVFTHVEPNTGFAKFWNPVVNPNNWCGHFEEVWQ